jgi:hypothetical protein
VVRFCQRFTRSTIPNHSSDPLAGSLDGVGDAEVGDVLACGEEDRDLDLVFRGSVTPRQPLVIVGVREPSSILALRSAIIRSSAFRETSAAIASGVTR